MDGPGFHVDVDALEQASSGVLRTVEDQKKSQLADVDRSADTYGNDAVHSAIKKFCENWNEGLDLLTEDAKKVGDVLGKAAKAYRAADNAAAGRLTTDPGEGAVK